MNLKGWPFEPLGGGIETEGGKPPGGGGVPS
jgi:hypothetical protein